jgi:hypothetical protein
MAKPFIFGYHRRQFRSSRTAAGARAIELLTVFVKVYEVKG